MKTDKNKCKRIVGRSAKRLGEIQEVISHYHLWDEWIISRDCFLLPLEKEALILFLEAKNLTAVAHQLGVSISHISLVLNRTRNRLSWNYKFYRQWVGEKLLEEAGAYKHISARDRFLCRPLHYHKMHYRLYSSLRDTEETLADILKNYTTKDLLQRRNFGNKKLLYFQQFLEKNNCLHLLKA